MDITVQTWPEPSDTDAIADVRVRFPASGVTMSDVAKGIGATEVRLPIVYLPRGKCLKVWVSGGRVFTCWDDAAPKGEDSE